MFLLPSRPSFAIHFLHPCPSSFFILPLSFSQCTYHTLNILPFKLHHIQYADKERHIQDAERTHCVASMPNRHWNLCRVKHRISIVPSIWSALGGERWWERQRKKRDGMTTRWQPCQIFLFFGLFCGSLWANCHRLFYRGRRQRGGRGDSSEWRGWQTLYSILYWIKRKSKLWVQWRLDFWLHLLLCILPPQVICNRCSCFLHFAQLICLLECKVVNGLDNLLPVVWPGSDSTLLLWEHKT